VPERRKDNRQGHPPFQADLLQAAVVVVDNDSTDRTRAKTAGAVVIHETSGKGAVQTILQKTDADAYLMVDADDTYPSSRALSWSRRYCVMPTWSSVEIASESSSRFRVVNRLGNEFYRRMINLIFGTRLTDVLSGYRCLSRRLVRGLPIFVTGFEVEVELTVKSLERGFRIVEVPVDLGTRRPEATLRSGFSVTDFRSLRRSWRSSGTTSL
jgi:glycosyltransferase involved in cell wall biosynthesis